uniref:Uncharacterized protein n=1 Tax=Physcomitrium patens TaxID=3218 RepID=A0A2K1KBK2_PHYPA|nr:hypothetical protein PHYPA_010338 [Physcomitrium patens]
MGPTHPSLLQQHHLHRKLRAVADPTTTTEKPSSRHRDAAIEGAPVASPLSNTKHSRFLGFLLCNIFFFK